MTNDDKLAVLMSTDLLIEEAQIIVRDCPEHPRYNDAVIFINKLKEIENQ